MNSNVHAFALSPEEWRVLEIQNRQARHLRMACCSSLVVLRISSRGIRFFAHKSKGTCTTAPETEAHLVLKNLAAEAARTNGWNVHTEVRGVTPSGDTWVADVLAVKGRHKVAIEVQWSPQTIEETIDRRIRYIRSGVRCLWLLRSGDFPIDETLPAVHVGGSVGEGFVALVATGAEIQHLPMCDFLNAVFSKRFRFGVPLGVVGDVSVRAGYMSCYSCGADTRIVTGVDVEFGPHRYEFSISEFGRCFGRFDIVRERLPKNSGLGVIKQRYSKALEQTYLSNGCAHCGTLIGQHYEYLAFETQEAVCKFPVQIDERWRRAIEKHVGESPGWGVYLRDPVTI